MDMERRRQMGDTSSLPSRPAAETAEQGLSALLKNEYYLLRVLEHLIDDGLHECRRVCRLWCNTCDKLPVKMKVCIKGQELPVLEKFPNCVSMDARVTGAFFGEDVEFDQTDHEGSDHTTLLDHLSKLGQLKTLTLTIFDGMSLDVLDALGWSFASSLEECHPTFRQLRSLEVVNWFQGQVENEVDIFFSQLRYLTNLTSLRITLLLRDRSVEPLEELRKIEHLDVGECLVDRNGQLMFPNLTNLTYLEFMARENYLGRFGGDVFEAILPYASSLESICIDDSEATLRVGDNKSLVKEFSRLKSVYLIDAKDLCLDATKFWPGLKHLSAMTSFTSDNSENMARSMAEDVSALTKLRSLTLIDDCDVASMSVILSNALQLTKLDYNLSGNEEALTHLTGLKDLNIWIPEGSDIDLASVLVCMPLLETLCIENGAAHIPNSCLTELENLTSLELSRVVLDSNPFAGLAVLPELKELRLSRCSGFDNTCLSEVNRLTSLQTLWLHQFNSIDPCSYIEEKLIRLRDLSLDADALTAARKKELYRRLPSLRRIC